MNIRLGEKIRTLRKNKNISQEILAQYLGVSFQAISKWENGSTMPDVTMIPAIASFFEVSTDELFDFNRIESEQKIQQACWDIADWRNDDPEKAEAAYRNLLRQYPGNEIVLSNLLYVLQRLKKNNELVDLCKTVIASTKDDGTRYDAARILAETYKAMGEYALCKNAIDLIPEFFFTHREEKALLLEGEDMFRPAWQQKEQSIDSFLWMSMRLADYYEETGDMEKAKHQLQQAKGIVLLLKEDDIPPFWKENYYMSDGLKWIRKIDERMANLSNDPDHGSSDHGYVFDRFS
ncbi:MAG: helix-turn-helix domain-containing protein [Oscillospiraceae bacterium]|nr:helix-turn-helix domain-containing protein [Oscillospiraceae bacterium]